MGLLWIDLNADPQNPANNPSPGFVTSYENRQYGPPQQLYANAGREDVLVYHARNYTEIEGDPLYDPNRHTRLKLVRWDENGCLISASRLRIRYLRRAGLHQRAVNRQQRHNHHHHKRGFRHGDGGFWRFDLVGMRFARQRELSRASTPYWDVWRSPREANHAGSAFHRGQLRRTPRPPDAPEASQARAGWHQCRTANAHAASDNGKPVRRARA